MDSATPIHRADLHENDRFLERAIAAHQTALVRYASRLLGDPDRARDVVQDTFTRLMAQRPEGLDGHVAEWLFTVCRNRAMDVLRKESRMRRFAEGQAERLTGGEPIPGRRLEAEEARDRALGLLGALPANQQEVVRLKFQNGFSYKQISGITGLTVTNVGFLIHTAVSRLRREFAAARL
jgi:RNA polymerase sigma-70 factor (ECF subfamily)